MSNTCSIPDSITQQFRKFKLGRNIENAAFVLKINRETLEVEIEETINNITPDDLSEYLPDSTPRFLAYSYKHTNPDGRVAYPLVFIYYCPPGINPHLNMMYASTKQRLANALEIMKVFDINQSSQLTETWLKEKLAFFG